MSLSIWWVHASRIRRVAFLFSNSAHNSDVFDALERKCWQTRTRRLISFLRSSVGWVLSSLATKEREFLGERSISDKMVNMAWKDRVLDVFQSWETMKADLHLFINQTSLIISWVDHCRPMIAQNLFNWPISSSFLRTHLTRKRTCKSP